jgi:nucleotide-binding universal stress UspA family protein
MRRRWPDADVVVIDPPVVEAVVAQARKWRADVVVLGSRGRGVLQRIVRGSVSRDVMHEAECPALIVKGRARTPQRFLIGLDGSIRARRAVEFVSRLSPPPRGGVTLLAVIEPMSPGSISRLPGSVRSAVMAELAAVDRDRMTRARRELSTAARRLARTGWATKKVVRRGIPLAELLRTAAATRTDVTVVGARGATGLKRLLLGSVAEGALANSPGSVLVVK